MQLTTLAVDMARILATNDTGTSFTDEEATITEPTGAGVVMLRRPKDSVTNNGVMLVFFAVGDNNDVFDVRVYGMKRVDKAIRPAATAATYNLWVPILLCDLTCTVGARTGVAGSPVVATELFVDTITVNDGNDGVSIEVVSPAEDMIAHVIVDTKGCEFLKFDWDQTTGSPTSFNGLVCEL